MVETLELMSQKRLEGERESALALMYSLTYQGQPAQIQVELEIPSTKQESPWIRSISAVEGDVLKTATLDVFDDLREAVTRHLADRDLTDLAKAIIG